MTTTAKQFAAMLAEKRAACEVYATLESVGGQEYEAAGDRCTRADDALLALRPTSPAMLAAQLRWMLTEQIDGSHPGDRGVLEHISEQLEAMAAAAAVLSPAAVAQIRAALVQILDEEYGAEADPGPDDDLHSDLDVPGIERLRAAIKLLDAAAGSAAR